MKKLLRVGPYADFFSQGVQVDNILTLAGQIGIDSDGNIPESIKDQMAVCYANINEILHHYDATLDNIIDETWFVTDIDSTMAKVEDLFAARAEIYGKKPEVSQTLVQVAALVDPSFKIEIKCIACL